ncbi:MAG: sugar ABC transporter permease [Defluviitaleaceae bacterium]|nr:sugar ABC transporter permease [Defluviitaleaceae bacterium]
MNAPSAIALKENPHSPTEAMGGIALQVMGVVCVVFGIFEFISALSTFRFFPFELIVPWADIMLGAGGGNTTVSVMGVFFALLYIILGLIGVLFSRSQKIAFVQVGLCLFTFAFHILFLVVAFFAGGFHYIAILLLAIPIVYLTGAAKNTGNRKIKNTVTAYSFIAPNLVGFSIFTLVPMGFALALGFMNWDLATNTFSFVGLANFVRMRTDHLFWPSLRNTLYFTVVSVPLTLIFSLSLALLLNNKIKGRAIFRSLMFFPHVASLIAMAAVWNQIFHPTWGPVTQFLQFLGMTDTPRWTITPWVIPNIILFTAWRNMGYFMIIYLAGLQSIPQELYEAAAIDGANAWNKFRYITLPQLRFVTFFVSVLLTIMSFRVFDQVIMITNTEQPGSGSSMLVVHIFRIAFLNWDMGYASALALVLLGLVLTITIIQFAMQKRYEKD